MSTADRDALVQASVPRSDDPLDPVRYAVSRQGGALEWFVTRRTREHPDGRIEIHGHPFKLGYPKIPPAAARRLRDAALITPGEYRAAVRS